MQEMRVALAGITRLSEGIGVVDGNHCWKDSGVHLLLQCSALDLTLELSLLWRLYDCVW